MYILITADTLFVLYLEKAFLLHVCCNFMNLIFHVSFVNGQTTLSVNCVLLDLTVSNLTPLEQSLSDLRHTEAITYAFYGLDGGLEKVILFHTEWSFKLPGNLPIQHNLIRSSSDFLPFHSVRKLQK